MSLTLKEMLNQTLGESAFLQEDAFAAAQDVDNIQMVAFANRASADIRRSHPWDMLRKTDTITLVEDQLSYDLPEDFDWYVTESMWKSFGARHVVIPTSNRYWAFLKAGNPGNGIEYYAKFIQGKLEFNSVSAGDVINLDYCSLFAVTDSSGVPKQRFNADTDLFLLDDDTLILGTKAFWKTEKEMPTGALDMQNFQKYKKRDIGQDTPAKIIRSGVRDDRYLPYAPPISQDYLW